MTHTLQLLDATGLGGSNRGLVSPELANAVPIGTRRAPGQWNEAGAARFEIVSTEPGFLALEPEWNALWARADKPFLSGSFA